MANSADPEPESFRSSLIWVCTVCLDLLGPLLYLINVGKGSCLEQDYSAISTGLDNAISTGLDNAVL